MSLILYWFTTLVVRFLVDSIFNIDNLLRSKEPNNSLYVPLIFINLMFCKYKTKYKGHFDFCPCIE